MSDDLPLFPIEISARAVMTGRFRYIDQDEIKSGDDLELLLKLLWEQPEVRNYLFVPAKGGCTNELINNAERFGRLVYADTEFYWYRHPHYDGDFVRISTTPVLIGSETSKNTNQSFVGLHSRLGKGAARTGFGRVQETSCNRYE